MMKSRAVKSLLLSAIFFSLLCAGQERAWESSIQAGKDAMAKKQYAEAENYFRQSLTIAEKFGEKDVRLGGTYLFLAQACEAQSRKEEAESFAVRGVEAMEKALAALHPRKLEEQMMKVEGAAVFFDQTGDIFASHHKYPDAEKLYQRVIQIRAGFDIQKIKTRNNDEFFLVWSWIASNTPKLAAANEKLAQLYSSQGKLADAAALYEQALKTREANLSTEQAKRTMAVTLADAGACYTRQAKYSQAEPMYRKALALLEQAKLAEKPEAGYVMENYAVLLEKTNRQEEARTLREKAAAIKRNTSQIAQ
jgi:tetratricopeptide (TPR) repeat protein